MGTTNIHEPEVKDVKPASRSSAAVLPKSDLLTGVKFTPKPMFADSILDFGQQKKRQSFATTFSFVLNCVAIGVMLLMPLIFTENLPKAQMLTFLVAPPPPPPPPPPPAQVERVVRQIQTDMLSTGQLRTPTKIPQRVQMIHEEEAPPPMPVGSGVVGGIGGLPGGQVGGVIGSIVNATSAANVPRFIPPAPQRVRISQGVTKGLLIQKVEPQYPSLARSARVQGEVVLSALIDANGQITNLQLVSGHPMLVPAAIAAVKQWRYKPYLLNGAPVEVETTITVIFSLSS